MDFEEILEQTIKILHSRGQVSYRALKRQFEIDDQYVEDLKYEIIDVLKLAFDKDQQMLVLRSSPHQTGRKQQKQSRNFKTNINLSANDNWGQTTERRQLTVMFCDLVESSSLAERLDPEDLRDVFLAYQELCATAIADAEGYIARYLGDGVLIYFGFPQAHENDPIRAVRSGLKILEALQHLNPQIMRKWGERLSIRIGIHTGLVVIGEMGVKAAPDPMAIVGATPNLAARLQSFAQPNTLVISDATHHLIDGFFTCQCLAKQQLKGISEPIAVFQVLSTRKATTRFAVSDKSGLTPFVNRCTETALLLKRWKSATLGQTHAVLLQGEAGIGKSRLVWEIKKKIASATTQDILISEIQGSPYYRNSAFYPITDFLKTSTFNFGQDDTGPEKRVKIEDFIEQSSLPLTEYVPLLSSLLGVPYEDHYAPLALTSEQQKQKTIEAMAAICSVTAKQQPVLLVIEDLHWMDASTLDVITYFLDHIQDHSLLMLLTYRPEFKPPWAPRSNLSQIQLSSLGKAEIQEMVVQTAQERWLPQRLVQQIVQKTDGVPLFVEELTKTVLEAELDQTSPNVFSKMGHLSLAIPTTLRDSLIERLDRLSKVKKVAQLGATLGREFDYDLLEEAGQWNQATLRHSLNQLVTVGLLYQEGSPPFSRYQFKHALIQDAAYQSLVTIRRQFYHQQVAYTLERRSKTQESIRPELLAYHFTEAGLPHAAIQYWLQAGKRDLAQAANTEAIAHFSQGLELLTSLAEEPERDRMELQMQLGLAPAYMAIKGWATEEVEQSCIRARDLSEQLADVQSLSRALWGLWTNYFLRGQLDPAKETALTVYQLAHSAQQPLLQIIACHAIGYTNHFRGEYIDSRTHAEQGISLHQWDIEQEIVLTFQFSSTVAMRIFLATSLWMLGYSEQAASQIEQAFTLVRKLKHLPSYAYALALGCCFHHYNRDFRWVEEKSAELLKLSLDEGFLLWPSFATTLHGWAIAMQGDVEQGIREMQQGITSFAKTDSAINLPHMSVMLAEGLIQAGQWSAALDAIDQGIQQATERNEHHMEPELYRLQAEVFLQKAVTANNRQRSTLFEQAEESLAKAITVAQQQQALMLELRAVLRLSKILHNQTKRQAAYTLLSQTYNQFTEGFQAPELQEARAMLARLKLGSLWVTG